MTDRYRTHLEFLVDMSGSMSTNRFDAGQGFDLFIEHQRRHTGYCTVTLNSFSSGFQNEYRDLDIAQVPSLRLRSSGGTALYDGLARAINDLGVFLSIRQESERPNAVVVVIVTDGVDTASRDFSAAQVKQLVDRQSAIYEWSFIYLGSGQDAVAEGSKLGIPAAMCLTFTKEKAREAYIAASDLVTKIRRERNAIAAELPLGDRLGFTEEQRSEVVAN